MFLKKIESEKAKDCVLDLCIYAANANDVLENEEREFLDNYCMEMKLPYREKANQDVETVLGILKSECSEREKRGIVMEIFALLLADGVFDSEEEVFLNQMVDGLEISRDFIPKCRVALDNLTQAYVEISKIVD